MPADVVVVGGGPAGLATALAARRLGLGVVVLDRREPPLDKACGEGLMPDGLAELEALGVSPARLTGAPFRGIRYLDAEETAQGDFPGRPGLGVRRTELHRVLVGAAAAAGAVLRWGVPATGLGDAGVETPEGTVPGRWIVAADGLHSTVRRWAGLEGRPGRHCRYAVRRHFRVAPWSSHVEVHWGPRGEAYVTPVGPGEVGVALLWSGGKADFESLLPDFPRLAERLGEAPSASRDRGAAALHQRASAVWRGRLALVGDAAGYLDAITGEGLTVAFRQARALAAALSREDPAAYGRAHRRLMRLPTVTTSLLLVASRRPWLRRRMLRALARDPALFDALLAVHVRQRPARSLGLRGYWRLARGVALGA